MFKKLKRLFTCKGWVRKLNLGYPPITDPQACPHKYLRVSWGEIDKAYHAQLFCDDCGTLLTATSTRSSVIRERLGSRPGDNYSPDRIHLLRETIRPLAAYSKTAAKAVERTIYTHKYPRNMF